MGKSKIQKTQWLIDFLEKETTMDSLIDGPEETIETANELIQNFFSDKQTNEIWALVPALDRSENKFNLLTIPEDKYSPQEIVRLLAIHIFDYYQLLKPIWDEFKDKLDDYRNMESIPNSDTHSAFNFPPTSIRIINIPVQIDFDKEKMVLSGRSGMKKGQAKNPSSFIEDIYEFLLMLEGIPFSRILRCKECGDKWFISNRDGPVSKREFCSNRCTSRNNKRRMRNDPARKEQYEEVKRKQRERYRKKVLGEKNR